MIPDAAILHLKVVGEPDVDPQESADLARSLRQFMLDREIPRVEFMRSVDPPTGAKGDPVTVTTLVVTLSSIALKGVVDLLRTWLTCHDRAIVTIETGGEKLTINGSPSREQQETVGAFLDRHKA